MGVTAIRSGSEWFLAVALLSVTLAGVGGAYTYAAFSDAETATVSIGAAEDFTVDEGRASLKPSQVADDSRGVVRAFLNVSEPERVDETRFTLSLRGGTGSVTAERATCEPEPGESWNCKLTFDREDLLELADGESGTYPVVIGGWWEYDRDFEVVATLGIEDGSSRSAGAQTGSDRTPTRTTTPSDRTETSTAQTPAETRTPTPSPTETVTSTPDSTSTPTPVPTPSPTPTETATPTPTPTETATPTSTQTESES